MSLESIVRNAGKGVATGAVIVADPVGSVITGIDYLLTGVGPSDRRALPTLTSKVYQRVYPDSSASVGASGGIARGLGLAGGATAAGFGLYVLAGPVAAIGVPVGLGLVSVARSGYRFGKELVKGESGVEPAKGRFWDGAKYGYQRIMNFDIVNYGHGVETLLTGRSIGDSSYKSTLQSGAGKLRRNLTSYLGQATGAVGGLATLGGLFLVGNAVAGPVGGVAAAAAIPVVNFYRGFRNTLRSVRMPE